MFFSKTVYDWFLESSSGSQDLVESLYDAIWASDAHKVASRLTSRMADVISYHDYGENFYHAFLLGLLASSSSAIVLSNRETGEGMADIVVTNRRDGKLAIFELKRVSSKTDMESGVDAALAQIEERGYSNGFPDASVVLVFGLCFCRKSVVVKSRVILDTSIC